MKITILHQLKFSVYPITRFVVIIGVSVFLFAGCSSDDSRPSADADTPAEVSVQTFKGVGVVKTITPTKNYINIDHEEITGYMGAMAMFFPVPDTSVLHNIAVDDSISFTIEVKAGRAGILEISVID